MWIEKALQIEGTRYEGRSEGGVMKSALAYFEALSEMGVHAGFKEIREYDFDQEDYSHQAIILAHQISIPFDYWSKLEAFVTRGGTLIVEGLTAYYDENAYCIMGSQFPFKDVFGASVKEFKMVDELFDVQFNGPELNLKGHLWRGRLLLTTAKPIAYFEGGVIACKNTYGKGKVIWIPMLLGLGARISGDYQSLLQFLGQELQPLLCRCPIRFKRPASGILLKFLKSRDSMISILVNKSTSRQQVDLELSNLCNPRLLFGNKNGSITSHRFTIDPEETLVIRWDIK
jgi:beta-galactosidase